MKKARLNKSKLNKKGFSMIAESDKILFWFIVVFVIILCVVLIISWTSALRAIYLNDALEPAAYEARLIYSDKCFAYKDRDTDRVYSGTIDPAKFNQDTLFKCLPLNGLSSHAISAKLETQDGKTKFTASSNWDMKTDQVIMRTYVVNVQGYGPGLITFYHKSGE